MVTAAISFPVFGTILGVVWGISLIHDDSYQSDGFTRGFTWIVNGTIIVVTGITGFIGGVVLSRLL
jgi:hypothetical protein